MPSLKTLIPVAGLLAVFAAAPSAQAERPSDLWYKTRDYQVCLVNKGWIVWKGHLRIERQVGGKFQPTQRITDGHDFHLLLNQSKCVTFGMYHTPDMDRYSARIHWEPVGPNPAESSGWTASDLTFRMDGTAFQNKVTVITGIRLD